MATVGTFMVELLAEIGVRQIFGIVGDALNPLTEAVRRDGRIEWIGVRHEEGAALAAAGQAKLTGRLGVCAGTTGPGGTHLVAGLYEARKDHAPVLAITGDVVYARGGTDTVQAVDQSLLFRDVSAYTGVVAVPSLLPQMAHEAIAHAYGSAGVAHLTIPQDVIGAKLDARPMSPATLRPLPEMAPNFHDIRQAADMIDGAKRVTLFVGDGARGAASQLLELSSRIKAPLVHTFRAKDMIAYDEPRWVGGLGLIGSKPGLQAIEECDLLILVGTDYPWIEYLPKRTPAIQIDTRAFALGRRMPVALGIVASARPTLEALIEHTKERPDDGFFQKIVRERESWENMLKEKASLKRSERKLHPQALARMTSDLADDNAVFCIDVGTVTLWCGNWIRQNGRQRIICSFNNAAVGTGLGQANGIQALDRQRQVIALCGDGGFTMLMPEFMTAVHHELPVKVVVFNNERWGLVHLEMEAMGYPAYTKGADFPNCDFAAFARACGVEGFTVEHPDDLRPALAEAFASHKAAIVDVHVNPAELPVMPHLSLEQAYRFGMAKVREAALALAG